MPVPPSNRTRIEPSGAGGRFQNDLPPAIGKAVKPSTPVDTARCRPPAPTAAHWAAACANSRGSNARRARVGFDRDLTARALTWCYRELSASQELYPGDTELMTTFDEVALSAEEGESKTIDFKATTSQRTEAARTLSAMLNGRGGRVLLGVHPGGRVAGQQVGERTLQDVTQACQEIHPWHPPSIDRVSLLASPQREVLVVTVPAGNSKPYSHNGHYYVRSGASTVDMPQCPTRSRCRWSLNALMAGSAAKGSVGTAGAPGRRAAAPLPSVTLPLRAAAIWQGTVSR